MNGSGTQGIGPGATGSRQDEDAGSGPEEGVHGEGEAGRRPGLRAPVRGRTVGRAGARRRRSGPRAAVGAARPGLRGSVPRTMNRPARRGGHRAHGLHPRSGAAPGRTPQGRPPGPRNHRNLPGRLGSQSPDRRTGLRSPRDRPRANRPPEPGHDRKHRIRLGPRSPDRRTGLRSSRDRPRANRPPEPGHDRKHRIRLGSRSPDRRGTPPRSPEVGRGQAAHRSPVTTANTEFGSVREARNVGHASEVPEVGRGQAAHRSPVTTAPAGLAGTGPGPERTGTAAAGGGPAGPRAAARAPAQGR